MKLQKTPLKHYTTLIDLKCMKEQRMNVNDINIEEEANKFLIELQEGKFHRDPYPNYG
jgi:hypothetical protein